MATFEPDEPITSIKVKIYTADVAEGGTDDDVFIELFDWPKGFEQLQGILPCAAEIDTSNYNDFERGSKRVYELPSWYYADRIVNDIRRVCVHKSDDGPWGGWAFQGITVWLNGKKKELFTSLNPEKPNDFVWLEDDDRSWCGSYTPIEFIAPSIENVGLPDADSDMEYDVGITATGGRKPLSWSLIEGKGHAFR